MAKIIKLTEDDLTNMVKQVIKESEKEKDDKSKKTKNQASKPEMELPQPLSNSETLKLLMVIWERIPLGIRMNNGGMPREIPSEIQRLLDKKGYKIVKV